MEQALGSTDPPDKSERNSRQMCFGDKEDPMEKKMHCCLWSKRIGSEQREYCDIYFMEAGIFTVYFLLSFFVLYVFMANTFYR